MNFDKWYCDLISDQMWFELLRHYKDETIRKAGEKVFAVLVADGTTDVRPMSENRKHVYNILVKNPGDKVNKPWYVQKAEEEAEEEQRWEPVSEETRAQRLKEWAEIINNCSMLNSMPKPSYKQLAEEGGVLPPKPAPYPCTSKEEAYVRDRRFAYIKHAFEPRTGDKLPGALDEDLFNAIYDEKHLTDKGL